MFLTFISTVLHKFIFLAWFFSGELKTASLIDRERTQAYNLIAQATDGGGLFCRSEIILTVIDVNDNAPSFLFTEYLASVFENAVPQTLITRLQAEDPDESEYLTSALCLQHIGWICNSFLLLKGTY